MTTFRNKPGTVLKNYFHKKGIKQHKSCACKNIQNKMDKWGTKKCRIHSNDLARETKESAKKWKKKKGGAWNMFPVPPVKIFEKLILWACDEAEK